MDRLEHHRAYHREYKRERRAKRRRVRLVAALANELLQSNELEQLVRELKAARLLNNRLARAASNGGALLPSETSEP